MRSERAAGWAEGQDRIPRRTPNEFPRIPMFPRCRDGDAPDGERPHPRLLADDQGGGALPQAECAWARTVWLPKVMRAPWIYWGPDLSDSLIGQIL